MRDEISRLIIDALGALDDIVPEEAMPESPGIERTRDPKHGDFASNIAMTLAKKAKRKPRELAELIVEKLPKSDIVERVEVAGPGFINFALSPAAFHEEVREILASGTEYGRSQDGANVTVLVEFVSANPTGPLHVGHGRHAAYGATVANLLAAVGHPVHREYYLNDAGRQMDILAASVWIRYLEIWGENVSIPAAGYRGTYILDIAEKLRVHEANRLHASADEVLHELPDDGDADNKDQRELYIDALIERAKELLGERDFDLVRATALESILRDIKNDLNEFGVEVDEWFSEKALTDSGDVSKIIGRLREQDLIYPRDGAMWFRAEKFGDEKDRVVVRENGQITYIASDIAYHLHKRERGNEILLDILGADHHGYVARVRAGLEAMGEPPECLEVQLVQFVSLYRGEEKVQMSTRSGEFVTLRDLRDEVGKDAARFFFVMHSNDQAMNFDLELAKARTNENPVYYIQYAHARIHSVFRKLDERGLTWDEAVGKARLEALTESHEQELMFSLSRYPEIVELAATNRAPQHLAHYLRDLANDFHTYYNALDFIVDDASLRNARLSLTWATGQVIRNGLGLLGVNAPDSM